MFSQDSEQKDMELVHQEISNDSEDDLDESGIDDVVVALNNKRFHGILINCLGEEIYWKNIAFTTYGSHILQRLANRASSKINIDFCHLSPIPKIAIEGMIIKINTMKIEDEITHIRGGEYFAFINTLKEEMMQSIVDAANVYSEELSYLNSILNGNIDLNETKEQVIKIYRNLMMQSSSYADAQYEGAALAENLNIHLVIRSRNTDNSGNYIQEFGPPVSPNTPLIVLYHTQGNRGAHFVLDKVQDSNIPHSIAGTGNCLFDAFAQAVIELYIQYSGAETSEILSTRRTEQFIRGVNLGLIPRESIIARLKNDNDLIRQRTAEILCNWKGSLNSAETEALYKLSQSDTYQTVRIAAAETLCLCCSESYLEGARYMIIRGLSYPGLGQSHTNGAELVRMRAAQAILNISTNSLITLNDSEIEFLRTLCREDSFQTVKIEVAKILFLFGNESDRQAAKATIITLVNYQNDCHREGAIIVRQYAIHAIPILQSDASEIIDALDEAKQDINDAIRAQALMTLDRLGQLKKAWTIVSNPETEEMYGTNGMIFLALQLHPYACFDNLAFHYHLLNYQRDHRVVNFIRLIQKCICAGTKQYPDKNSFIFRQLLNYSIRRYYELPFIRDEEKYVSLLFSLPDRIMPTLSLYDMLLLDFISRTPQGIWRAHQKGYTHFKHMTQCHQFVQEHFTAEDNKHSKVIQLTLTKLICHLYAALHAFKDHNLLNEVEFSNDELQFMEQVKHTDDKAIRFRALFLGEDEVDIFHVQKAHNDEERTVLGIATVGVIQIKDRLSPYYQRDDFTEDEQQTDFRDKLSDLVESNRRYTQPNDAISFLLDLRGVINGTDKRRQLLGIAFKGSFFDGERTSFDDENAVHLCFTEQFRVAGSIFLEYVGWDLREELTSEFGTRIHVRVPFAPDDERRLTCHYTIRKIWTELIDHTDSISPFVIKNLIDLMKNEITVFLQRKAIRPATQLAQEQMSAYLGLNVADMIERLGQINVNLSGADPVISLSLENKSCLKRFGDFILNTKMYSCVEVLLVPEVNSGLIFPVILNPIEQDHKLVAFTLPVNFNASDSMNYTFSVAKPCERFCQYATTAYDVIAEINSHFAELRGFLGNSFPEWERRNTVMEFSDDELSIVEEILSKLESTIDEKHEAYNKFREMYLTIRIDPDMLINLQTEIAPELNSLILDVNQCQVRALKRAQDYRHALQNRQPQDTYPALGNDRVHHETVADGNCALSAVALGLLYHKNNGNDLLTTHHNFRKQFAISFGINPDTFMPDAFSQVINALLSPAINLDNPIIKLIITKLRNIENTAPGTEKDQIDIKIKATNNRAIKPEVFEHGNVRLEYFEEAIKILARQGILYQLAMAYVLRNYCTFHCGPFTCRTNPPDQPEQDFIFNLQITSKFGEYLDHDVIAFLANIFNLTVWVKFGEFGRNIKYGLGDLDLTIFHFNPPQTPQQLNGDSHFELVLPSVARFLESRLQMPNTISLRYPSILTTFGVRENKATGPRVERAIEKIKDDEKHGKHKALAVANQFCSWAKAHNRHFNIRKINTLFFEEQNGNNAAKGIPTSLAFKK